MAAARPVCCQGKDSTGGSTRFLKSEFVSPIHYTNSRAPFFFQPSRKVWRSPSASICTTIEILSSSIWQHRISCGSRTLLGAKMGVPRCPLYSNEVTSTNFPTIGTFFLVVQLVHFHVVAILHLLDRPVTWSKVWFIQNLNFRSINVEGTPTIRPFSLLTSWSSGVTVRGADTTHKSRRRGRGTDSTLMLTIRERRTSSTLIGRRTSHARNSTRDPTDPQVKEFESLAERIPLTDPCPVSKFGRIGKHTELEDVDVLLPLGFLCS